MNYNFRSYNPEQPYLLPPSLDDWLPQDHLARFISETVDQMDLSALITAYRANGQGSAAYHPAMMVKILLYAYCMGIPSSRKIAKALVDDVAFRWLAAGNFPDFRTISEFRKRHLRALQDLFPQILLLCKASGLVKAGIIALDGTKVKANASLSRNKTYEQLSKQEKRLKEKLEALLEQAEKTDQEEDRLYGSKRGDELPEDLSTAEKRLAKIKEAKKYLEARKKAEAKKSKESHKKHGRKSQKPDDTVKPETKVNMTDSESRIQKTSKGYIQGYNAQAVATEDQIVIACDVVNEANDIHQLKPMLEQAQQNLSEIDVYAKTVLADAGYCSDDNLEYLESKDEINALVSTRKEQEMRKAESGSKNIRHRSDRYKAMDRNLQNPVSRYIYGFRKRIIEPVFGQMKHCQGFPGFLLRGLEKVKNEFTLWCSAHNILKLYRYGDRKTAI
ncbi:MAG: IS1182 family transposase [Methanophagales archaeon]|nr:IS1182 family transposase [Methanophagales archaeon]